MESSSDEDESGRQDEKRSGSVVDMEDLGTVMNSMKKAKVRLLPQNTFQVTMALKMIPDTIVTPFPILSTSRCLRHLSTAEYSEMYCTFLLPDMRPMWST